MATSDLSRRAFLARIGVLGAGTLLLPGCLAPERTGELDSELVWACSSTCCARCWRSCRAIR